MVAFITQVVESISAAFPGAVELVELPTITLVQRMQLWSLADVAVCTPLREGVSTFPLEAVYARREGCAGRDPNEGRLLLLC